MNGKWLRKTALAGITVLAVCALVLPLAISAPKAVERPFKSISDGYFDFASLTSIDIGEGTHLGRFIMDADWEVIKDDPDNPISPASIQSSNLVMTAANGDELHFRSVEGRGVTAPDLQWTGMGTGVIEGGTGRFENASGSTAWSAVGYLDPGEMRIHYTLTITGTLTY